MYIKIVELRPGEGEVKQALVKFLRSEKVYTHIR